MPRWSGRGGRWGKGGREADSRASEILNGKRDLTLDQIRLLAKRWRIPPELLVGELEEA
jgi:hypothetical protein